MGKSSQTSVCATLNMHAHTFRPLAKGQIWKTRVADIEIMGLGNGFIHYKITKQLGQRRVSAQVSGIEAMERYLLNNAARLVKGSSRN